MQSSRLDIVIGIIERDGRLLISRRHQQAHQGGKWEFPGGKQEAGEAPFAALCRELDEELGIRITGAEPWRVLEFDYPDRLVRLQFWQVGGFEGEPEGREGQQLAWVLPAQLEQYPFPEANQPIIEALSAQ